MAAVVAGDPRAGLLPGYPGTDVLAGARIAQFAGAGTASAHHAVAVPGVARWRADAGIRHAGRRPAGRLAAVLLVGPHGWWGEPAGGHRRTGLAHHSVSQLLLSSFLAAGGAGGRVASGQVRHG